MTHDEQIAQLGREYHAITAEILQKLPPPAQIDTLRMMFSIFVGHFSRKPWKRGHRRDASAACGPDRRGGSGGQRLGGAPKLELTIESDIFELSSKPARGWVR